MGTSSSGILQRRRSEAVRQAHGCVSVEAASFNLRAREVTTPAEGVIMPSNMSPCVLRWAGTRTRVIGGSGGLRIWTTDQVQVLT